MPAYFAYNHGPENHIFCPHAPHDNCSGIYQVQQRKYVKKPLNDLNRPNPMNLHPITYTNLGYIFSIKEIFFSTKGNQNPIK